jgi:mannose/fructose/N-acetylgalactosamine-specific phosphotransferase system component IID
LSDRGSAHSSAENGRLGLGTLVRMYLRSFFSQGSFGYAHRQNIGFAFCMEPAGKQIWKGPEDRKKFLLRHLDYYNGNPFMVTLVLGAVAKMEERLRDGDGVSEDDISRFKLAVGQAVGSVGDRFFWRTLRPFGLAAGLAGALFFGVWGVPIFLAVFNIPLLWLKWSWLKTGYSLGPRVVIEIQNRRLGIAADFMETVGAAAIAFIAVAWISRPGYGPSFVTVGTAVLFAFAFAMPRRKIASSLIMVSSGVIAVLLGFMIG